MANKQDDPQEYEDKEFDLEAMLEEIIADPDEKAEVEPEPAEAPEESEESENMAEAAPCPPKKETTKHDKKHRQLAAANRFGAVLRVFVLGTIVFGGSIFLLVGTRPTESAEENRKLSTFPTISWDGIKDGSYAASLMNYYEDTVPGRSSFKHLISTLQTYTGIQGEDEVSFFGSIPQLDTTTNDDSQATPDAAVSTSANNIATPLTTTTVTTEAAPEVDPVEIGDGIVLVDKRAINLYGGSFTRGETYAATLNAYKEDLGADVNVYSMVVPTSVSFYLPDSYAEYTGSEIDNINHINENLKNVTPIDVYSVLESHKEEDIYARTDHHWLPLGAFYAAQTFAKTANTSFASLSDYTATTLHGYVGSMYTFTKSAILQNNPEDFTYYTPKNQYTTTYYDTDLSNEREGNLMISLDNVEPVSWYLVFMGSDERITHVKTDTTNDRTLVIVKDSYGNALIPCLTQSFSDIYVIDMRYFDINAVSYMKQVGATDVLFAMNTFSATGGNSEYLETIRTQ